MSSGSAVSWLWTLVIIVIVIVIIVVLLKFLFAVFLVAPFNVDVTACIHQVSQMLLSSHSLGLSAPH
jgi:hypothetical protein